MHGTARRDFGPQASEVRAARHFAIGEAARWGLEPRSLETVVGELAANAYCHAGTPFSVSLVYADDDVSVEVGDGSAVLPVFPDGPSEEAGRGLVMVDRLAEGWGVRSTGSGKVVWADVRAIPLR